MAYDLIVIGSGPGGYSAAVRAGQYGLKTAIIEKDPKLGGACLHVGCIPTKALLHTADVWEHFVHSSEEGIHCENPKIEYAKVLDRKNKIVAKHAKGVEFLMKKNKIDWIKGYAKLKPRAGNALVQVEVKADGGMQTLESKNVIIATGSEARMLPGLKPDPRTILTNIEILDLPVIPKTMLIIGAGAVGVEFASIFNRFGTKVTVLEMLPRLVPVEDEDVSKELERYFKKTGIRCETGAKAENIAKTEQGVRMCMWMNFSAPASQVFMRLAMWSQVRRSSRMLPPWKAWSL
jgi:dihydrolipoamide dehydrogenase